jgi:hypothetical protein
MPDDAEQAGGFIDAVLLARNHDRATDAAAGDDSPTIAPKASPATISPVII